MRVNFKTYTKLSKNEVFFMFSKNYGKFKVSKKRMSGNKYLKIDIPMPYYDKMKLKNEQELNSSFIRWKYSINKDKLSVMYDIKNLTPLNIYHLRKKDSYLLLKTVLQLVTNMQKTYILSGKYPLFNVKHIYIDEFKNIKFILLPLQNAEIDDSGYIETVDTIKEYMINRMDAKDEGDDVLTEVLEQSNKTAILEENQNKDNITCKLNSNLEYDINKADVKAPKNIPIIDAIVDKKLDFFDVGYLSDIGDKKPNNQDKVFIRVGNIIGISYGVFLIADGVGGMSHGEVASAMVSDRINAWYEKSFKELLKLRDIDRLTSELDIAIENVNKSIIDYSKATNEKLGSTMTLLVIIEDSYIIRHIGDSRIYFYDNKGLHQMTTDHTYVNMELMRGNITPDEAENHPRKNILTQCIGVRKNIEPEKLSNKIPKKTSYILLSCDGFYNAFPWNNFEKILENSEGIDIQLLAQNMRNAIAKGNALDNISLILIKII